MQQVPHPCARLQVWSVCLFLCTGRSPQTSGDAFPVPEHQRNSEHATCNPSLRQYHSVQIVGSLTFVPFAVDLTQPGTVYRERLADGNEKEGLTSVQLCVLRWAII